MIRVTLVGNPNTGKTTLFNTLTGAHEHVGNWHGVTVEEKVRKYNFQESEISIVDLPGIYSLTPLSFEEKVAVDYLKRAPDDLIVNICDASNLQRNLYLTLSLIEMGANIVLAINQIDKRPICKIDFAGLEKLLGVKVVYLNAGDKKSVAKLNEAIVEKGQPLVTPSAPTRDLPYIASLRLGRVRGLLGEKVEERFKTFYAVKLLEDDEPVKEKFGLSEETFGECEMVAKARYDYIDNVLSNCSGKRERVYGQSKLDKVLLNRFFAFPIFLGLIAIAFYITFFSLGAWLADGLSAILDALIARPFLDFLNNAVGSQSWIYSLFENAIFRGVGAIIAFLPQVGLLFLFLTLLEDSGYLSRVAFVFEDILGKVGLSGKSVYTLLMGFGCSTTAVLTARNMEDKNSKIKTGLLTPYMSCSAKFPIYTVLGGAFFGTKNIFVILGLYLLGVVVAILMSYIFEKTVLKSKEQSFILEFPPYRVMSVKRILSVLWQNIKLFLGRVGSLIIAMNIIVWLLSNFSFLFKFVGENDGVSMLETLGKILSPLFIPLGFNSWGLVSALIAGLVAKEVIVSSIAMFGGVDGGTLSAIQSSLFVAGSAVYFASASSVLSYLVFCLLYIPCLASVSVLSKEIGKKWTAIGVLIEFLVAYMTAFVVYTLSRCFEVFGEGIVLAFAFAILAIIFSVFLIVKRFNKSRECHYCHGCKNNCGKKW